MNDHPVFRLIGNINQNWEIKNTHKMGMGNFKESAGMPKNTLCMCKEIIRLKSNSYLNVNRHSRGIFHLSFIGGKDQIPYNSMTFLKKGIE